jgi:hypothetical protein
MLIQAPGPGEHLQRDFVTYPKEAKMRTLAAAERDAPGELSIRPADLVRNGFGGIFQFDIAAE